MPDLLTILTNFASQISPIIMMLQGIAVLMGLWFVAGALMEIWGASNDNAVKFMASHKRFTIGSAVVQLVIGSLLLSMGTLELVGIMSRSLSGDYATARSLSYIPQNNSFEEQRLAALGAIVGIMQIVGFVAMIKGWLTLNRAANGQAQAGIGTAVGWLIGGVIAWNFKWFVDVINCSLGFNIIALFAPFGTAACR